MTRGGAERDDGSVLLLVLGFAGILLTLVAVVAAEAPVRVIVSGEGALLGPRKVTPALTIMPVEGAHELLNRSTTAMWLASTGMLGGTTSPNRPPISGSTTRCRTTTRTSEPGATPSDAISCNGSPSSSP